MFGKELGLGAKHTEEGSNCSTHQPRTSKEQDSPHTHTHTQIRAPRHRAAVLQGTAWLAAQFLKSHEPKTESTQAVWQNVF